MPLISKITDTNLYRVLSVDFKRFYRILFVNVTIYCWSEEGEELFDGLPDSCDCSLEIILYLLFSQAPKSTNLQRLEQKGENWDCSVIDVLMIL